MDLLLVSCEVSWTPQKRRRPPSGPSWSCSRLLAREPDPWLRFTVFAPGSTEDGGSVIAAPNHQVTDKVVTEGGGGRVEAFVSI